MSGLGWYRFRVGAATFMSRPAQFLILPGALLGSNIRLVLQRREKVLRFVRRRVCLLAPSLGSDCLLAFMALPRCFARTS